MQHTDRGMGLISGNEIEVVSMEGYWFESELDGDWKHNHYLCMWQHERDWLMKVGIGSGIEPGLVTEGENRVRIGNKGEHWTEIA